MTCRSRSSVLPALVILKQWAFRSFADAPSRSRIVLTHRWLRLLTKAPSNAIGPMRTRLVNTSITPAEANGSHWRSSGLSARSSTITLIRKWRLTIYRPVSQNPVANMLLLVRTSVDPTSLTETIARAVRTVDPDLPVASVRTMDEIAAETAWRLRFVMSLLSAFALMAVGLAALGVYGVLNYNVTQRMREMAIRMSLGARPFDVFRIIIGRSMFLVVTGLAAGTAIALWLSRFLASFLYGVTALDLSIYLSVALVMTAVGLMAAIVPARRATKVDPGLVLRPE